mgnify:FL=1
MKTQVLQIIEDSIKKEESYISEHEEILNILKPLEGKTINGIVLNAKRLGRFKLTHQYGMFYIVGEYEHLTGYDSDPIIKIGDADKNGSGFEYYDCCHGDAARKRIEQLKKLDVDLISSIFGQIKTNFDNICQLFGDIERNSLGAFNNPAYYDLLHFIHPENDKNNRGLRITDFYYIRK